MATGDTLAVLRAVLVVALVQPSTGERPAPRKSRVQQQVEEAFAEARRYERRGHGFLAGSVIGFVGALGLFVPGAILSGGDGGGCADPPNCVTGKLCGCACIEMSDTCHIASGGGGGSPAATGLLIGGAAALVVGITFAVLAHRSYGTASELRHNAGRVSVSPGGLRVRF